MAAVSELIRTEADGTISFGDYTLSSKTKRDTYEFQGDIYKVKTFCEITRFERNGLFVYESVPGTAVNHFSATEQGMEFLVEAKEDAQITLGLEEQAEYEVYVDDQLAGDMMTNIGGKLSLSVELDPLQPAKIRVVKK